MATAYITMGTLHTRAAHDSANMFGGSCRSETVTTSGTSALGALVGNNFEVAQVVCATTVIATVSQSGASPATLATGIVCYGGIPQYMSVRFGDRIALIDG